MNGLNLLKDSNNGKRVSKKLLEFLKKNTDVIVHVGIVHGDFHRDNIMCKGNMPVLIDFDCSRKNDICAIDALYYILEEVRHKNGYKKTWLEEWLLIYENIDMAFEYQCVEKVDIDLKLGFIILLLERIAQDQQYDYCFMEANKNSIKKICHKLMNEDYLKRGKNGFCTSE